MSFASPELEKWLLNQKEDYPVGDAREGSISSEGEVIRFELIHTTVENPGSGLRIDQYDSAQEATDLAQVIWDAADQDASTYGTGRPQRYTVHAWKAEQTEPSASHSFVLPGRPNRSDVGETEPANEKGHLGQLMRHNERTNELMYRVQEASVGRMMSDLKDERDRRTNAEAQLTKMHTLHQGLLDRSQERDLIRAQAEARAKRLDEMMALAVNMLPIIASKFLTDKGQPTNSSRGASEMAIQKILKNLGEDEFEGILKAMKPQNQMALLELYEAHQPAIRKDEENKPELFKDN